MDVLTGLPVWTQLVIVFLVAAVLVAMNFGWLLQAKSWLDRQKHQRPAGPAGSATTPARTAPPARPDHDRV
jgi:hypothetical protein